MEFNDLRTKGDFMQYCLLHDSRIKEIDSAYPMSITKTLIELGMNNTQNYVMCYWKNGSIELLNIIEHATILHIRGV